MPTKTCKIDGTLIRDDEGEAAVLFDIDGEEVWIPRSQLFGYDEYEIEVSEWWATEKELV